MPGLLRGVARTAVIAGTATAVSNRVSRRQAGRWAQQEQAYAPDPYAQPQYAQPQYQAPPAAAPTGGDSAVDQLERLAALRDQGVLSQEEFAAQKARILNL